MYVVNPKPAAGACRKTQTQTPETEAMNADIDIQIHDANSDPRKPQRPNKDNTNPQAGQMLTCCDKQVRFRDLRYDQNPKPQALNTKA